MRFRLVVTLAAITASTWLLARAARAGQDGRGDEPSSREPTIEWQSSWLQEAAETAVPQSRSVDREEAWLDLRIHRVSRDAAALDHEIDPAPANYSGMLAGGGLTPFSFQLMGYLSVALALFGFVIVVCNRPTFGDVRGKNESRDARRTVVRCTIVLIVLNLADLGFTSLLVPTRSFVELNPLAESLMDSLPALIFMKSALIAGGTLLLLSLWRHKIAQLASWGTAVTYVFAAMWWVMYFHAATS